MIDTVQERESVLKEIQTAVRHTAVYGLAAVLTKVVGFLMIPFYTHYLTPTDYGVLEILDLSISLFGMFLGIGMMAALLRCCAATQSIEDRQRFVSTSLTFVFVTGAITALIALKVAQPVSLRLFGPQVPYTYLLLSVGSFILSYIGNIPRTYLRALEASGTITILDISGLVVMLALNIYFIAVLKVGLVGVLLSTIIVTSIQVTLMTAWAIRKVGIHFSSPHLGQMVKYGWPLMFSHLAIFALNFSDRFFLQHLRGLEVVGIYAVGYKFGYMLNFLLVQPFVVMWQARMFIIHAQPDHARIFRRIFILYTVLLIYAWLVLSVISPEIVHLMVGPKFAASQDVIPLVALAYVFWGIAFYVQLGMYLTSKTKLIGIISAVAAALNLGLNYLLIGRYGMSGAAWATLLSFVAIAVGSYFVSQRVFHQSLAIGRIGLAFLLAVALFLFSRWLPPVSLALTVSMKAILLVAFPVLVWSLRVFPPSEMAMFVSATEHIAARLSRLGGAISGRAAGAGRFK